jgi:hypothetical protein
VSFSVDFKCPSCGLKCSAQVHNNVDVVIHEVPTCERYDRIQTIDDGTEFMREARLKELQTRN